MADLIGLRVRDRTTGLITVDLTDRLTRLIGSVYSGTSAGSISVPGLALGDGWAAVLESPTPNENPSALWIYPNVSISGSTLSWAFPSPGGGSATPVACDILYGVY